MLPPESKLEVVSRTPARDTSRAPLLFVHGGYCDAWCWTPYFLPYFARNGYAAHALSLRGHGASGGRDSLFLASLDDYAADVAHVAATLPAAPVVIGHSMGAAVVERLLATRPLRAAALLAPIPPSGFGPILRRLAMQQPEYLARLHQFDPRAQMDILDALRPMYFSDAVEPRILTQIMRHLTDESPRALFDLTLRLHAAPPIDAARPFVLGAEDDRVCSPLDVHATAKLYDVEATILPGLAHMMMLEMEWRRAADAVLAWLEGVA